MSSSPSTAASLESQVLTLLVEIAPDVDPASVRPDLPFRDQFDFDSMDFFNFATAVHQHFGLEIPERDYAELRTLAGCAAYLRKRLPGAAAP